MDANELLERLPLVTYVLDLDRTKGPLYVSPQIEALFGVPADAFMRDGGLWRSRLVEDDRPRAVAALESVRTRGSMSVEYRIARDHDVRWLRDTAVIRDGYIHGYLVDVTREKELERDLARERATLDAFFRDSAIGLAITDAEGRYVRINDSLAAVNRLPAEDHLGKTLAEIAPELAAVVDPLRAAANEDDRFFIEVPLQDRQVMVSFFPFDVEGELHHGRVVIDLTEQRRAELAERKFRHLLDQLPLVAYVNEALPTRRATFVTPRMEELTGYAPEEFIADPELGDRLIHPDDLPAIVGQEEAARAGGEPFEAEYRIVRADGEVRWVLDRMETVYDDCGEALYEHGFLVDVTDLHETTNLLRAVWDGTQEAMVIADDGGRYVDANPAALELFGRSRDELLGRTVWEVMDGYTPEMWTEFRAAGSLAREATIRRANGELRELEAVARADVLPGRHLAVLRDVTERKQLEQELWRSQKLESVGRLAGGVAHDFNNLLTAIRGFAQLLQARAEPGSVEHGHASEIDRAADRAAGLTAQLLALGRRQHMRARPLDLNDRLEAMRDEIVGLAGGHVDVSFDLDPALCAVRVDPRLVARAIANLVANAVEAMPDGGTLAIATAVADVEGREDLADGRYAVLSVRDDGHGLEPAALEHVFEPFFTTKEVGEGSGLGLASAYGTVRQSGGTITVESAPGRGATFTIYLPEAGAAADGPEPTGAGETVLVVERDPALRDVLFEHLTDAGYRVLTARTPLDAQRVEAPVDVALSDVAVPGVATVPLARPYTRERLQNVVRSALGSPERVMSVPVSE